MDRSSYYLLIHLIEYFLEAKCHMYWVQTSHLLYVRLIDLHTRLSGLSVEKCIEVNFSFFWQGIRNSFHSHRCCHRTGGEEWWLGTYGDFNTIQGHSKVVNLTAQVVVMHKQLTEVISLTQQLIGTNLIEQPIR